MRNYSRRALRTLLAIALMATMLGLAPGAAEATPQQAAASETCFQSDDLISDTNVLNLLSKQVECRFEIDIPDICDVRTCVLEMTNLTQGIGWWIPEIWLQEFGEQYTPSGQCGPARFELTSPEACAVAVTFAPGELYGPFVRVRCESAASPLVVNPAVRCNARWYTSP